MNDCCNPAVHTPAVGEQSEPHCLQSFSIVNLYDEVVITCVVKLHKVGRSSEDVARQIVHNMCSISGACEVPLGRGRGI